MPTLPIANTTLHYDERGSGPPVILLHGFPVDSRMWSAQLDGLSSHHRIIAPDFRGFGRSRHDGPFTLESLADDIHAFAISLGIVPFTLGGLSMGGYVALAYARRYPRTLRALMLIDTKSQADTQDAKDNRNRLITLAREKGASAVTDDMLPKLLAPATLDHRPDIVKALREMADNNPPAALAQALAAMRDRPERTDMLKSIAVPTLIIVGEADSATPPEIADAMQKLIPGSQLAVIPGAGHMSPLEQPAAVNAAIARFLASLP